MRVLVDGQVFTKPVWHGSLIRLFDMAVEGRHRVFPDPLDAIQFEKWLNDRDDSVRDEIRFAIESGFDLESRRPALRQVRITTASRARWSENSELPLGEALQVLSQPLSVVVENQRNDRDFLLAVADFHQRRELQLALKKHWLRFEHGGGLQEMFQTLKEIDVASGRRARSFWIFDSDAMAPGCPSPGARRLRRMCERKVAFHCLERRSAENYLPLPSIREIWAKRKEQRERARKARAFERLSDRQRHHFNMKNGFSGDDEYLKTLKRKANTAKIADEVRALFASLDAETRALLSSGLDSGIVTIFSDPHLHQEDAWFENDGLRSETRPMIDRLIDLS